MLNQNCLTFLLVTNVTNCPTYKNLRFAVQFQQNRQPAVLSPYHLMLVFSWGPYHWPLDLWREVKRKPAQNRTQMTNSRPGQKQFVANILFLLMVRKPVMEIDNLIFFHTKAHLITIFRLDNLRRDQSVHYPLSLQLCVL